MQMIKLIKLTKNTVSQINLLDLLFAKAMTPKIRAIIVIIKQIMARPINNAAFKNTDYKGIFPCFFLGNFAALFSNILNARINFSRVSSGLITSST